MLKQTISSVEWKATPLTPSLGAIDKEATPPLIRPTGKKATPPSLRLTGIEATPLSVRLIDTEAMLHSHGLTQKLRLRVWDRQTEVIPPSL